MAVFEVFAHPEVRRYKTTIVSKAAVFQVFCVLITFIVPIIIAYRSGGIIALFFTNVFCPQSRVASGHWLTCLILLSTSEIAAEKKV
jgi:hypothetical protein